MWLIDGLCGRWIRGREAQGGVAQLRVHRGPRAEELWAPGTSPRGRCYADDDILRRAESRRARDFRATARPRGPSFQTARPPPTRGFPPLRAGEHAHRSRRILHLAPSAPREDAHGSHPRVRGVPRARRSRRGLLVNPAGPRSSAHATAAVGRGRDGASAVQAARARERRRPASDRHAALRPREPGARAPQHEGPSEPSTQHVSSFETQLCI